MSIETHTLSSGFGTAQIDPMPGNISALCFVVEGRKIQPLHRAPWLDEPGIQADETLLPVERRLAGDFFCAPFGAHNIAGIPNHGHSANTKWHVTAHSATGVTMTCAEKTLGAQIRKQITLSDTAPLLYQEHWISGGEGKLTVAHHPMTRLSGTGRLFTSPKQLAFSPENPLEPGRNVLKMSAESDDITVFPAANGGVLDLTRLPIGDRHEDFVTLTEAKNQSLGWTALIRDDEDDILFILKDPQILPVTMLWFSNGGRDYSPWNGRHLGVLGIEDGCAFGAGGYQAAIRPNKLTRKGIPTALDLAPGRTHRIAHVIGAVPRPAGWDEISSIELHDAQVILKGPDNAALYLPFRAGFFEGDA